jgi:hypothetical protein
VAVSLVFANIVTTVLRESERDVTERVSESAPKGGEQGATIAQMKKQIETPTAIVLKVRDQFVLSKPAPLLVANP